MNLEFKFFMMEFILFYNFKYTLYALVYIEICVTIYGIYGLIIFYKLCIHISHFFIIFLQISTLHKLREYV